MKLPALLWSAFVYAVVWVSILGSRDLDATAAVAFPQRFRPAELVVEGSSCSRSGDEVLWRCEAPGFLSGEESGVEGRRAVLRWTSEDGRYIQDGERQPVLAAALPLPFLPAAVVPPVESPRAWGVERLGPALKLPLLGLGVMALAAVVGLASGLLRARGPGLLEVEHSRASPGCAVFALGLGVPILMLGGDGAALGWGLGLIAVALLAGLRRYVIVDRGGATLTSGWQLFFVRTKGAPKPLGVVERVAVVKVESEHAHERRLRVDLCAGEGVRHEVAVNSDPAVVEREARKLAELLAVPWGHEAAPAPLEDAEGEADDVDESYEGEDGLDDAEAATEAEIEIRLGGPRPPASTAPAEGWAPAGPAGVEVVGGGARSVLMAGGCLVLLVLIGVAVYFVQRGGG